ncbi:dihydroorotase [Candidatus Micrarchaeota archaeon]|nr:dihydroorotase [Candidatus Micrarchaeota archaeon]
MILTNVKAYINGEAKERVLEIKDGRIEKIRNSYSGKEGVVDGKGLLVLPGGIDSHVHLREPGATQKEDFYTGSRAAIAGGFTTVMDMPNNPVPTITAERLKEKIKLSKKALCEIHFHFGAAENNFNEVKKADPESLKIYMGQSTGEMRITDKSAEKHMQMFDRERPIVIHAEDQQYIERTGKRDIRAALIAVEKANKMAERTDRVICIAHTTSKQEILSAKSRKKTMAEIAPHYMFLSAKDREKLGNLGLVYPPLRDESTRMEVWKHLDKVDYIGSDHAPHLISEKNQGAHGFPGLETTLPLLLDAYNRGLLELGWIVEKTSENPAEVFNFNKKGHIREGNTADLILVDMKKEWKVRGDELETKCRWSPYEGRTLKGKVFGTIKNGETIYWNYNFQ